MGKSWGGGVGWLGSSPCPPARGVGGSEPGRARGARRRWSRRRVLGRTRRDAGSARRPLPIPPCGPVAPLELSRRSWVGGRRPRRGGRFPRARSWRRDPSWGLIGGGVCGVWAPGETRRAESSAEELPLGPGAGDGRCGTSNRLGAFRGRRFETSRRASGGRAPASQAAWRVRAAGHRRRGAGQPVALGRGSSAPAGCPAASRPSPPRSCLPVWALHLPSDVGSAESGAALGPRNGRVRPGLRELLPPPWAPEVLPAIRGHRAAGRGLRAPVIRNGMRSDTDPGRTFVFLGVGGDLKEALREPLLMVLRLRGRRAG